MDRAYSLGLYEKAMPNGLGWPRMLESARLGGFDRLEISIDEGDERLSRLDWSASQRADFCAVVSNSGTAVTTMCLSGHRKYPFGSHDAAVRERALDIMKKSVELSFDVGIRIIQLAGYDVYYEQSDEDTLRWFAENLAKAVEFASEAGVILAFETMETPFMDTVNKAMKYVKLVGSPYLGVYPDIGNLKNASVLYNSDLLCDIKSGAGHIFAAHLKETSPGIYRELAFGSGGHTEYVPCIKQLWSLGVRIYTGEFWYLGEADYMKTLRSSSAFLRKRIIEAAED